MRKLIVGVVVALVLGTGAYFGVEYWAARAAIREVDAALDQWRASVGTATRGSVEVDLWTRGVRVRDVNYVFCQPWPYPSSLMIGCHAHAVDPTITVDKTELEDARWFPRADIADALESIEQGKPGKAFQCPPRYAIAHMLMRWWVEKGP